MNDKIHISETDFEAFMQNRMSLPETNHLLEHIGSCNYCSDQFTALMSGEIINAPRDMKNNILQATKRPEVQLALKVRETSKQVQLLLYSLKIGTATIGALLLLILSMNFTDLQGSPGITHNNPVHSDGETPIADSFYKENDNSFTDAINDGVSTINNNLLNFSHKIMNLEVFDND